MYGKYSITQFIICSGVMPYRYFWFQAGMELEKPYVNEEIFDVTNKNQECITQVC